MTSDLSTLPTAALLAELARRCQVPAPVPSWAVPALVAVARHEGITPEELIAPEGHSSAAVFSRHLVMAILIETCPGRSLAEIAGLWKMDHGTAIHARKRIAAAVAQNGSVHHEWQSIISSLPADALRRTAPRVSARRNAKALPSCHTPCGP